MQRPKTLDDFPHLIVSQVVVGNTLPNHVDFNLVGHFDQVKGVSSGRCWLLLPERTALIGDLTSFDPQTGSAMFNSAEKAVPAVQGQKLPYLSAYWQAHHVWMILDEKAQWERIEFHAVDAISESFTADDGRPYHKLGKWKSGENPPARAQIVTNGWDHEHCELCNAHIDPGDYAFMNGDGLWVCPSCFDSYVNHKNLSFVDEL